MKDNSCENLEIQKLVRQSGELVVLRADLSKLFMGLWRNYSKHPSYKHYEESIEHFNGLNDRDKIDELLRIIEIGTSEDILEMAEKKMLKCEKKIEEGSEDLRIREEELLNAWSHFNSWKSKTSKNLIRLLNSKSEDNEEDI